MHEVIDIGVENIDSTPAEPGIDYLFGGGGGGSGSRNSRTNINSLVDELNNLSDIQPASIGESFFGSSASTADTTTTFEPKIGQATATEYVENSSRAKTWDGYERVDPASFATYSKEETKFGEREKARRKKMMLKRLEELQKSGKIAQLQVSQDSSFEDIEDEYNGYLDSKLKKESIRMQKTWLVNGINLLEWLNAAANPFNVDLTGWGDKVEEDLEDSDEILGELYEKYKSNKLGPEARLLMVIAGSALAASIQNRMISGPLPDMGNLFRANPDIMKTFIGTAVDGLNRSGGGGGGGIPPFAQDFASPKGAGPPPPVETKAPAAAQPPQKRAGATMQYTPSAVRPDLAAARQSEIPAVGSIGLNQSGIDIGVGFSSTAAPPPPPVRPEMKGPTRSTDLDSIIAGLKKKEPRPSAAPAVINIGGGSEPAAAAAADDSMISVSSLRDTAGQTMPRRRGPKKRNTSERNISLDI